MHPNGDQPLAMSVEHDHATTIVTLRGELDVATVPRLRSMVAGLLATGHLDVVLDLHELASCDSTALDVLVGIHQRLDDEGGHLQLRGACARVLRVLEITALNRELDLVT
jgi:anti-sigma B factor antagonist